MKAGLLQLSHPTHSGKIRSHAHTSYAGLTFVLMMVGVLLLGSSLAASAAPPAQNPQAGSVGLSGTVRGLAPSTAAIIISPRTGSATTTVPVTVSGTCPVTTFVSITKNGVFGGVTNCLDDGTFSLLIDLFDGSNILLAQVSDALGQNGPASNSVTIFYNAPSLSLPGGSVGKQLFLEANTTVMAGNPAESVKRSGTIIGGTGPYAVSWDWGDGTSSLLSQAKDGSTNGQHTYARPGTYRVILRVTDVHGNTALLQLITVVNGPVEQIGSSKGNGLGALPGALLTAWPLYVLAFIMVIFFWLGERRQIHKFRSQYLS